MHRLSKNHATRVCSRFVVMDTESYIVGAPGRGDLTLLPLRCGVAKFAAWEKNRASRCESFTFTDPESWWSWLKRKTNPRYTLWLWCHNLGHDLTVSRFWEQLERGSFTLEGPPRRMKNEETGKWEVRKAPGMLCTKDPPAMVKCWTDSGHCLKFVDTFNWFQHSLSTIGQQFGIDKLPMPDNEATLEEWLAYCSRDVEITFKAVVTLLRCLKENDLGNLRYTAAAQALAVWRHIGPVQKVLFHEDTELTELERHCYKGGRTWAAFQGQVCHPDYFTLENPPSPKPHWPRLYTGPVHVLDVTAAYAHVMRDNLYPSQFERWEFNLEPRHALSFLAGFGGCAEVVIRSTSEPYPLEQEERVLWACGAFRTWLCGPELVRALQSNHVLRVNRLALYRLENLFTTFVDRLTSIERRYSRDSDPVMRGLIKRIRNGLHGKLGEWDAGWETLPGEFNGHRWGSYVYGDARAEEIQTRRAVAGVVQVEVRRPLTKHTFAAIPAFVCSYCREHMRKLIDLAGPKNTFYLDIDQIHVSHAGYERLHALGWIDEDRPGKLHEVKRGHIVDYFGPKHYVIDGKETLAGLSRSAVYLENGFITVQEWARLDRYLQEMPPPYAHYQTVLKTRPKHRLVGAYSPDGWNRLPQLDLIAVLSPGRIDCTESAMKAEPPEV